MHAIDTYKATNSVYLKQDKKYYTKITISVIKKNNKCDFVIMLIWKNRKEIGT